MWEQHKRARNQANNAIKNLQRNAISLTTWKSVKAVHAKHGIL